jgi:hypothetical protein
MTMMLESLMLTYHITGKEKYLEPVRSMARIRSEYLAAVKESGEDETEEAERGSLEWCAQGMKKHVARTLGKYRALTGDTSFDHVLLEGGNGYQVFRISGDRAALDADMRNTADGLRINREAITSEVRYTDRVLRFPSHYLPEVMDNPPPAPDLYFLYSSVTGDPGMPLYFPMNAVRWLTPAKALAALVTDSGTDRFKAELFHFGDEPRALPAELYLLHRGSYSLTLREAGSGEVLSEQKIEVSGPRTRVELTLPPRTLCVMEVTNVQ